jgi:glycosyltransferase involved in cell wall biosynthesis
MTFFMINNFSNNSSNISQTSLEDKGEVYLSVIIPVFKAENCLKELHQQLNHVLRSLKFSFEIIFIDDCGEDGSWEIICNLSKQDKFLRGFKLSRNFGQHNAIAAGLDLARGSWIVVMDCDLQDKPNDINKLIGKASEGFDIVIAKSVIRKDPWSRRVASNLFYQLLSLISGQRYEKGIRPFRIMSRRVVESLKLMPEQTRTLGPLVDWVGFAFAYIDVDVEQRYAGRSSYSWRRLLLIALDTAIAFSSRPLLASIGIGLAMSLTAFIYGLYIFLLAIMQDISVPGWTSLITSLYFIGGLILLNLGVLGLYLNKTFEETKGRPLYLVAQTTQPFESDASK